MLCEMDSRDSPQECPKCGGKMKRQLSSPVLGKASYQFRLYDSKKQTVATGRGGSKKGRWFRP